MREPQKALEYRGGAVSAVNVGERQFGEERN